MLCFHDKNVKLNSTHILNRRCEVNLLGRMDSNVDAKIIATVSERLCGWFDAANKAVGAAEPLGAKRAVFCLELDRTECLLPKACSLVAKIINSIGKLADEAVEAAKVEDLDMDSTIVDGTIDVQGVLL